MSRPVMVDVLEEVRKQDRTYGNFSSDPPAVFHGLNCIKEEHHEAMDAWREEKRNRSLRWVDTRAELVQVAAIALRLLRDMTGEAL